MAEVVLFHHTQGLTPGVVAFADELRHDSSLPSHDRDATALLIQRVLEFLRAR